MKKWVTTAMAAMLMFACVGCGQKEQVDEKDMSRWIVEFSSKYPNDMGKTELTVKELLEKNYDRSYFTVKFQYYPKYSAIAYNDRLFDLLPNMVLYYVNDAGERIENGELNDDKYSLRHDDTNKYDEEDKIYKSAFQVALPGKYHIEYALIRDDDTLSSPWVNFNVLETFRIEIVIGDIYVEDIYQNK